MSIQFQYRLFGIIVEVQSRVPPRSDRNPPIQLAIRPCPPNFHAISNNRAGHTTDSYSPRYTPIITRPHRLSYASYPETDMASELSPRLRSFHAVLRVGRNACCVLPMVCYQ